MSKIEQALNYLDNVHVGELAAAAHEEYEALIEECCQAQKSIDVRITTALEFASQYGHIDGAHHKAWVIDQMVRALTGCPIGEDEVVVQGRKCVAEVQGENEEYRHWVERYSKDEISGETYIWDKGTPP